MFDKLKDQFLKEVLAQLDEKGLRRSLRAIDGPQESEIVIDGQKVINFCSNNYLGLANDARLSDAAIVAMREEGFGAGASRLICGNMTSHRRLEEKLARFKGSEAALVFSTGYMANVGIISSLFGRDDIIFSDKFNHASIIDGILLSQAQFKRYPHNDMNVLEAMLTEAGGFQKRCIVTDSVFSMDGDLAPLQKIVDLARRYDCLVMVDEAHAFGVMGKSGKGLVEYLGLEKEIDIQMGTFSKAAGSFGAYCCGSRELIDFLINKARSFIYTTGMPPALAGASIKAIEIIETDHARRQKLWENTHYLKERIDALGFETLNSVTPIIPIVIGDAQVAVDFSKRLLAEGILVSAIRPPTVPMNTARLRVTVMANHTTEQLDYLLQTLAKIGRGPCLIS